MILWSPVFVGNQHIQKTSLETLGLEVVNGITTPILFPYHSYFRIPKDMGIVQEDYHVGVPGIPLEVGFEFPFGKASSLWCKMVRRFDLKDPSNW